MMATETRHNETIKANSEELRSEKRRPATVYDAVAGRIGANGFLNKDQLHVESVKPSRPEEVLLRRLDAPQELPFGYYIADEKVVQHWHLPDSELLKDIHEYAADFYEAIPGAEFNFRSLDETALLAIGILLEETSKEALRENGDMVFSEPRSVDRGLPESKTTRYQVIGKVIPRAVQEYHSASEEEEPEPAEAATRSRKRRRYRQDDE